MRILIAGATGALGAPLARALAGRGDRVVGLSRSKERLSALKAAGVNGRVVDVFDREALVRVAIDARPDVVVHALTALPKDGPLRVRDLEPTNRLRIEGTASLVEAARAAGARRLVAESFSVVYGGVDRLQPWAEGEPLPPLRESGAWAPVVDALRRLEAQVLESGLEGVVLRFGGFYGPEVGSTIRMLDLIARRRLPAVRADGVTSFVHMDDAVSATMRAIDAPVAAGRIYNIADDRPVPTVRFLEVAARQLDAPAPYRVPVWLLRLLAPVVADAATIRLALDNTRARYELGWSPAFPDIEAGLHDVVVRWRNAARRAHLTGRPVELAG